MRSQPTLFHGMIILALLLFTGCAQPSNQALSGAQMAPSPASAASPTVTVTAAAPSTNPGLVGPVASNTDTVSRVYQQASPSVVTVTSTIVTNSPASGAPSGPQQQGTGSGVIIDQQVHIVTNNHVVQDANRLEVSLMNGRTVPAQLVGRDPFFDLAVIQISPPGTNLTVATLGDSDQLQVGELAIAIGNPFGLEGTVTTGVISARRTTVSEGQGGGILIDAIQTDASINPGNSGGPLLNARGEVIGINTLARLGVGGGTAGINFAIPINAVKRIVPTLVQTGSYAHPFLGIGTVPVTQSIAQQLSLPISEGLIIQSVEPNSAAAQAGLRAGGPPQQIRSREVGAGGDVIVAADGHPMQQPADLLTYLERNKTPGNSVTLTVLRDGQQQMVSVTVGQRPPTSSG